MVWTQVERIDGIAKARLEWIHERDELLRRGRASGSRECAHDDKRRDTYPLQFM
jgi:hypothetical protein